MIDNMIYLEVFKWIWGGLVIVSSLYIITDTVRANKMMELKAMLKENKTKGE